MGEAAKKFVGATLEQTKENEAWINAIDRVMAVIQFDPTGNILTANNNFLAATGYTKEELSGKHHRVFCDPEYTNSVDYRSFCFTLLILFL